MTSSIIAPLFKAGYSIPEIIEMTGLCRQSIYNQINSGNLRTFKVGRRRLVSPAALNQWVKDRETETV